MQIRVYLKNAAILTVSGLVLRVLGMGFRVFVAARIGSEGMGLYQLILSVYTVFVSLATAGMNVAATRLAAQSLARGRSMARTVRRLVLAAGLLGLLAMGLQLILAEPLARYVLHDVRGALSLQILAPSLPVMAVAGALRGCFLARRRVEPNAVAQLVEQLVRMGVVWLALRRVEGWGAGYACAAVLAGNTVSEAVSCLLMVLFARRDAGLRSRGTGREAKQPPFTRRELAGIVLPVEGSRILASVLQAAEASLIPLCLALYLDDRAAAVSQYGALKGMALPLLFFPFSILSALSSLLMPEITRAHARRDRAGAARLIDATLRAAGLFSMLAGCCFVLFGRQAALLLYGDAQVGGYIQALGLVAPFMYLESMVDGMLKGLGQQLATFRYSLLDSALRILCIAALLPRFGIGAFLGIMAASNLLTFGLNTARLLRCAGLRPAWGAWLGRPAAFALAAGAAGRAVRAWPGIAGNALPELLACGAAVCGVYLALAALFGGAGELRRLRGSGRSPAPM